LLWIFEEKIVDSHPLYYSFDNVIDFKDSKYPSYRLIYALSKIELKVLQEYLDKMPQIAELWPSKLLVSAIIQFVPKLDGQSF
jgi:hypothetical protein